MLTNLLTGRTATFICIFYFFTLPILIQGPSVHCSHLLLLHPCSFLKWHPMPHFHFTAYILPYFIERNRGYFTYFLFFKLESFLALCKAFIAMLKAQNKKHYCFRSSALIIISYFLVFWLCFYFFFISIARCSIRYMDNAAVLIAYFFYKPLHDLILCMGIDSHMTNPLF